MSEPKIFDKNTILKIVVGSILGVLTIWLALRGTSAKEIAAVWQAADLWLVGLGVLIVLFNVLILAARWWLMLLRE